MICAKKWHRFFLVHYFQHKINTLIDSSYDMLYIVSVTDCLFLKIPLMVVVQFKEPNSVHFSAFPITDNEG